MVTLSKEAKKYRDALKQLTGSVSYILAALDAFGPHLSKSHGQYLAFIANALDVENDKARYFGLGVNFRTDKKPVLRSTYPIGAPAPVTAADPPPVPSPARAGSAATLSAHGETP